MPPAWVRCELLATKVGERFTRMEFIEHGESGVKLAQASGGCFPGVWRRIEEAFEAAGLRLEPGTKILVRLKPSFSANYGFSVVVEDIDPSYSLGDLKVKMEAIRRKLKAAGLWDGNRDLRRPGDFLRIAVISPPGAAGLGDFRSTVDRLAHSGLVEFLFFEAPFQTAEAPTRILETMRTVWREHKASPLCALAIIRGGGAAADLSYLVDARLAEAICRMPMPVMTGIGHQHDRSILDEVACMPFDTPSKVAEQIRTTVVDAALAADRAWGDIRNRTLLAAATLGGRVAETETAVGRGAHDRLLATERSVRTVLGGLRPDASASLRAGHEAVDKAEAAVSARARACLRAAADEIDRVNRTVSANARAARDRAREGVADIRADIARRVGDQLIFRERAVSGALANVRAGNPRLLDLAERTVADDLNSSLASARTMAEQAGRSLAAHLGAALRAARDTLDAADRNVAEIRTLADALDPVTVLQAGYAILRAHDGTPLTGVEKVRAAREVHAEMRDGMVVLRPES
jgi:exodeoxyribonuclease VII large subunit